MRSASERVRFQYAQVSSGVAYKYLIQGFIQSPPRTGSIKSCQNSNLSTVLCVRTPWTMSTNISEMVQLVQSHQPSRSTGPTATRPFAENQ